MGKLRWKIAQYFERKWWNNYLKKKDPEEYLRWKNRYWAEFLEKFGYDRADFQDPILDIGCGPAGIFILFTEGTVHALDPLLDKYVEDGALQKRNYPNVDFCTSSFEDFHSEDKFQTIFCLNAINHFEDIELSFRKLRERAAPDARIFLSIDAHKYRSLKRIFALFQWDILHPHQYTREEYEEFLRRNKLGIVSSKLMEKHSMFDYWVMELKPI